MFNRLIHFVSDNRIFTEDQNGVRKGKCIETAIQSFIERIQEALDKGLRTIGNFFILPNPTMYQIIIYYWRNYTLME
jgi:hypothetical protein